jgi:signal transduction histidine kinase
MFAADNETRRFDPADIIDQTLTLITWQRQPETLELQWQRPEDAMVLESHPATLAHVLMIVVENAVDILIERNVANPVIRVELHRHEGGLRVSVADNGGGIQVQPIERIFAGFFSAKVRRSSGMGLYIARMLVEERLRGEIEAENTSDGARLRILIPSMPVS